MKQLNKHLLTLLTTIITAASPISAQTVSQYSDNKNKKEGYLQKSLDDWLEKEWIPATKSEDNRTKSRFKLQDYIDKASLYMKTNPSDEKNSNAKKLESMPVIGRPKR